MDDRKRVVQIATRIQEALAPLRYDRYSELARRLAKTTGHLQQLNAQTRKMAVALSRHWLAAADRCRSCADHLLNELSYAISRVQQVTEPPRKRTATLALIVEELIQLEDEFADVEFEKAENTISVVTEPITLEGVFLGAFKIQLELNRLNQLYQSSPYRVIALDPNPAATDDAVTHPHVSSEKLCEGDGSAAIRAALEEGRICDFFTLVRSILNTYGEDSPYVALSDWEGTSCYDCGCTMSAEDTYDCYRCQHDYCSDCSTYCRHCEETVCLGCSGQCAYCEEFFCAKCVSRCKECGDLFCESCLKEDICPNCIEDKENDNEQQEEINENESVPATRLPEILLASREGQAGSEVQSDRMGETAVLQGQIG